MPMLETFNKIPPPLARSDSETVGGWCVFKVSHFWVGRVILGQNLLDLGPFFNIGCVQRVFDLVQLVQRQIRVQSVHLLELLQRRQTSRVPLRRPVRIRHHLIFAPSPSGPKEPQRHPCFPPLFFPAERGGTCSCSRRREAGEKSLYRLAIVRVAVGVRMRSGAEGRVAETGSAEKRSAAKTGPAVNVC